MHYPNDVCDVCNKWLFQQMKNYEDSTRILAVVSPRMKKVVSVYDKIYDLHLHDIIYTDDYLLEVNAEDLFYVFLLIGKRGNFISVFFKEQFIRFEILYKCC